MDGVGGLDICSIMLQVMQEQSRDAGEDLAQLMQQLRGECGHSHGHSHANHATALSELGETESLRLQMAMDRRSKLMTTLSKVMHHTAQTESDITRNLR